MVRTAIDIPQDKIEAFCRKHHIRRLSLFGSVLRDDFSPDSDVDVLVEFEPDHGTGFFGFIRMERELTGILAGRRVDLRTPKFFSPRVRDRVLTDAEVRYAAE